MAKLLSPGLHDFLRVLDERARRIEQILSDENICKPADVIPANRLVRVLALVLLDDTDLSGQMESVVNAVTNARPIDVPLLTAILQRAAALVLPEGGTAQSDVMFQFTLGEGGVEGGEGGG